MTLTRCEGAVLNEWNMIVTGCVRNSCAHRTLSSGGGRPDPLARRPNQVCDPYGQGGKPMSLSNANDLMKTLEQDWTLVRAPQREEDEPPVSLMREFYHSDYLTASRFVSHVAAVGHNNNHYPSIFLERRLLKKAWQVVTTVRCQTPTLGGLSHHDFFIGTMIDVEVGRPEVQKLLLTKEASQRKHT